MEPIRQALGYKKFACEVQLRVELTQNSNKYQVFLSKCVNNNNNSELVLLSITWLYNLCCRSEGNPSFLAFLRRSPACPYMVWGYPTSPPEAAHVWAATKRAAGGIPRAGVDQ